MRKIWLQPDGLRQKVGRKVFAINKVLKFLWITDIGQNKTCISPFILIVCNIYRINPRYVYWYYDIKRLCKCVYVAGCVDVYSYCNFYKQLNGHLWYFVNVSAFWHIMQLQNMKSDKFVLIRVCAYFKCCV